MKRIKLGLVAAGVWLLAAQAVGVAAEQSPLLNAMKTELDRSFEALQLADETPLYYLSYRTVDSEQRSLSATYGAIVDESNSRSRILDIDCRVGNHQLDNTHEIRGEYEYGSGTRSPNLPLQDDELAIRTIIWKNTDEVYKAALERYTKVETNQQVLVEREDTSADFSVEQPNVYIGDLVDADFDTEVWQERLRKWSAIFKEYPLVQTSNVSLSLTNDNRFFVDSDGAKIQMGQSYARLFLRCAGTAEDGMELNRYHGFDSDTPQGLPAGAEVEETIHRLIGELEDLMNAPLAQPYSGPAILINRASGVFFHEIFGHRIEGHRQKSEMEGQTFARKVGEKILPDFISIEDDATQKEFNGKFLRGYYKFDDEGVKAQRVPVVVNGVLKNFLMSRSPIDNYPHSNGHGRAMAGRGVVARQGNLMIKSTKAFPIEKLQEMLIEECRQQDKPYGLIFYDIAGGFTQTGRYGPQSFKVLPLLVYRVYPDGRPMEAIRGADIVGTPLTSFEKMVATGDDDDIFNGTCGAESGWVPVSGVSPSILVSQIEIEKKMKEQERPPLLDPPYNPAKPKGIR